MNRNDILWKATLEDLFDDFLRFFYPDAEKLFDFEKGFEYLDKELDQLFPPDGDNFAPRYVDKLVKVFTIAGTEEWILVHIEVQGFPDKDFAQRMFQYYYRILDQYQRPITAFAIFADTNNNFHPKYYERKFLGTRVLYEYNTYKIIDQNEVELEESNNPFALAVLSAKIMLTRAKQSDQQVFDAAYGVAKRLLSKQIPKEKIRKVMTFLRYYLRFENPEMFVKFEKEIAVLTERRITMGIEEFLLDRAEKKGRKEGIEKGREEGIEKGREEGIEKGREEGIEKGRKEGVEKGRVEGIRETALKMKKSGLDIELIASITGLSVGEIEKL